MLENQDFVAWANENVVLVVGHKGSSHKPPAGKDSKDPKAGKDPKGEGETAPPADGAADAAPAGCSLYPGLSCAEHEKIIVDATGEGAPKVEVKGFPTSFMIGPDGAFEPHKSDREPKACMNALIDYQKKFRLKIPGKKYAAFVASLTDADKAVEAGKWKDALAAYAKIDAEGKKLSALQADLKPKVAAMNAKVAEAFGKAKEGDGDLASKVKAVQALRAGIAAKLSTGFLPVLADVDAWLKANPAPMLPK